MIVRRATNEDGEIIAIIEKRCFLKPWSFKSIMRDINENPFSFYVVCQIEEKVVAYAGLWRVGVEGHIINVAVDPKYREQGIGRKLIEGFLQLSKEEGLNDFTLEVRASNDIAINLYKSFGFEEAGIRPKYYEDNKEDAIVMWRKKA